MTKATYTHMRRNGTCSVPSCGLPIYARHLCNAHYIRKRKGRPMEPPVRFRGRVGCEIGGCPGKYYGLGVCKRHYGAQRRFNRLVALVGRLGGKCLDCAKVYPVEVYDFHHRDPKTKRLTIGQSIVDVSLEVLEREADKCDLLCANCHRVRHGFYELARGPKSVHPLPRRGFKV